MGVSQKNGEAKTFANEYLDKTLFNLFSIKYIQYISALVYLTLRLRYVLYEGTII